MKAIFPLITLILSHMLFLPQGRVEAAVKMYQQEERFYDEKSGLSLTLPPALTHNAEENQRREEGEHRVVFDDGAGNDIALIISSLEKPISVQEFFFNYLAKECNKEPASNFGDLYSRPVIQLIQKNHLSIIKVSYFAATPYTEYLNTEYFFTHSNNGFNIWLSPDKNDEAELKRLEMQMEQILDSMEFVSSEA